MTSLRRLPTRPHPWPDTPRSPQWHPEKFRQQSGLCCLVSWQSTPSLRAQRLWPNSLLKWIQNQTTPGDLNHHQFLKQTTHSRCCNRCLSKSKVIAKTASSARRFWMTSSMMHVITLCFMHFVLYDDPRAAYGLVFRHRHCISAPISLFSKPQVLLNRPVQMEYEHDSLECIKLCMYFTFEVKAWPTTSAFSNLISGPCTCFQNKTIIQST